MPDPMRALTEYVMGETTMAETLTRVCDAAVVAVPPAVACGLSMTVEGRMGTHVFSHPDLPDIDRPQYDTGEGPCIDSFRSGRPVSVRNTETEDRYPAFARVARDHGVRSVLSLPMRTRRDVVGGLNLYATSVDAFDEQAVATGEGFAAQAAFVLVNTQAYWDVRTLSENLQQAMASRAEIEQAKGIIMATTGVDAEAAFERLREQSQHEHVKVRDLARDLVRRTVKVDPDPS